MTGSRVSEFSEIYTKMPNPGRMHGITPGTFSKWKTQFTEDGKRAIKVEGTPCLILHGR